MSEKVKKQSRSLQSGLNWQILIKFSLGLDKDLAYLGRFAGLHTILLGCGQPKTLVGTFFSNGNLSQPLGMAIRVREEASLERSQIPQI